MKKGLFARLDNELAAREKAAGLSMADLLSLPDEERTVMLWLVREGEAALDTMATELEQQSVSLQKVLESLIAQHFVRELTVRDETRYRARLTSSRRSNLPRNIWHDLLHKIDDEGDTAA